MGHKGGKNKLSDTYNKIEEQELLEGDSKHIGYIGIIDQLTINDENRLKQENQILTMDRNKLETRLDKLEELYKKLNLD
jgi:hypothetical protein